MKSQEVMQRLYIGRSDGLLDNRACAALDREDACYLQDDILNELSVKASVVDQAG